MRSAILASVALFIAALPGQVGAAETTTRVLTAAHSHAIFAVTHLYVAKVTGTVPIVSGSATYGTSPTTPISVEATLNARRVKTDDGDRDDDLQGPDWFDTKRFPMWTFHSTSISPAASGFMMQGTLTIHGVARPVALAVQQTHGLPHPAYHAVGHVDRHAFGMKITPQDGLIGSDVELTLDVEFE